MPWATGTDPARDLADNTQLQGTATWNGDLIGFTPTLEGIQGDAEISVRLATMDGRADFTALQYEDGSTWGDGDLGYAITVGANYLRSTGGDAGTVNGQFYGANHEGVGGSVERADSRAPSAPCTGRLQDRARPQSRGAGLAAMRRDPAARRGRSSQ